MELIDGALVLLSPQTKFHGKVTVNLLFELQQAAPDDIDAMQGMTMKMGKYQRPQPDLVVYRFHPATDDDWQSDTHIPAEDVHLVVEIVSEESQDRDRTTKPMKYAAAGIPHFWRVEREEAGPAIHVYELDGTKEPRYVPITIGPERLKLDLPFPLDIDVRVLVSRR